MDNYTYYLLRSFLHDQRQSGARERDEVQRFDAESGVRSLESPGRLDVNAQLIDLSRLRPERLDHAFFARQEPEELLYDEIEALGGFLVAAMRAPTVVRGGAPRDLPEPGAQRRAREPGRRVSPRDDGGARGGHRVGQRHVHLERAAAAGE